MTEIQYERWKDFSIRMARYGLGLRSVSSCRRVLGFAEDFFDTLDSEYFNINETLPVAWDEKWQMDNNGHLHSYEFLRDRIVDWDHTASHPTYKDQYGHSSNGPYICDIVSILQDERWNPHTWGTDAKRNRWDDLWGARIRCCLRAGIDMAVSPSMGVMGFTAGDIRRMYQGQVPEWLFPPGERLEIQHWDGVVPGIGLVPGKRETNGTFAELPDDARLWL